MVGVSRAWFVSSTAGCEDILEGLIIVFSPSIIAPESLDLISHWVYSDLKWQVGGGAGLEFHIWEQPYGCVRRIVVAEKYIVSIVS